MSKRIDSIRNEINSYQRDIETKKVTEARLFQERIERDRIILANSGILEVFKDIIDSKLVMGDLKSLCTMNSNPIIFSQRLGRIFANREERLDYFPAELETDRDYGVVSVRLWFAGPFVPDRAVRNSLRSSGSNYRLSGRETHGNKYVEVVIDGGKLCITDRHGPSDSEGFPVIRYLPMKDMGMSPEEVVMKYLKREIGLE